ncbi:uncharacterized protein [Haliotis cracherodii]|uniref:uncharacterized protein n=1 Tax=Haliotis cracherodii TaxID=6455 RepID=UPI0039EBFAA6
MPRLSGNERQQTIGRLQAGQSAQVVANAFNVNVRTIYRLQHRHNTTKASEDRPRSGRPRVTTPRQDRFIIRQLLQNRFRMATETARQTIDNHQRAISDRTVRRRQTANNISCHRPARVPILRDRHRQARQQWARQHQNWRQQQWRRIIFTDESHYCVSTVDGRVRIEGGSTVMLMLVLWNKTRGAAQTSWFGLESD